MPHVAMSDHSLSNVGRSCGAATRVMFLKQDPCCRKKKLHNRNISYTFYLQDPAAPETGEKHILRSGLQKFSSTNSVCGRYDFVKKADLAASGCLKDDCLVIKCTVKVITRLIDDRQEGDDNTSVIVPLADLSKDLSNLLDSGLKEDLTVRIGWFKRFKVHACVLAARSPVFRAQLCGAMMESRESSIRVEDVDAKVFKILMHYMYNDRLLESMDETTEETTKMTRHLLVAAGRYAMERLKLVYESRLSKGLDVNTVGFTLDLAEQYHCFSSLRIVVSGTPSGP
ncbi:BTB/POZ and MATH domain-containing protein 2-like, partial [Triticum aestivum]|uniref:BTB/POZ and MATH domain-containing protein 2-like n=1 Tax=Triticum aestivum TaxID=4565 RepID=UPI001D018856